LPYDYKDVIRQRQYATQKKGVKNNDFYVTKRGFYMDYSLKVGATVPGSSTINLIFRYISKAITMASLET
jgi:hypothetical protein